MPDGNAWCGITMKPERGIDCSYSPGRGKMYKPEPKVAQEVSREKVITKITPMPKIKPVPIKQKPVITSKKTFTPQIKMF